MSKNALSLLVNKVLFTDVVSHVVAMVPSLAQTETVEVAAPEGFQFKAGSLAGMTVQRITDVIHCEGLTHSEDAIRAVMEHDELVRKDIQSLVLGIARLTKTADDTLREKIAPVVESMITDTTVRAKAALAGETPITDVVVETFDWGCLADPIYLNTALSTCLDVANVFRSDLDVRNYYKDACASRVPDYKTTNVSKEDADAFTSLLATHSVEMTEPQIRLFTKAYPFTEVRQVFTEANASRKPKDVVHAIHAVTECVSLMDKVKELKASGESVPDTIMANVESMETACHLMTGAFQTRRELEFNTSVYLGSDITLDKTTVYVNADVCPTFSEESFSADDFGIIGQYFSHKKSANSSVALSTESVTALLSTAKPYVEDVIRQARLDAQVNENAAFGGAIATTLRKKAVAFKDAKLSLESLADTEDRIRKLKSDMTRSQNPITMSDGYIRFLSDTVSAPTVKTFYKILSHEFSKEDTSDNTALTYARTVTRFAESVLSEF